MAYLMTQLSNEFKVPVIDGVTCAVGFVEALVSAGIKNIKDWNVRVQSRQIHGSHLTI